MIEAVPAFCRHGRVLENCSICSKASRTRPGTVSERDAQRRGSTSSGEVIRRESKPARPKSVAAKRRAQRPGSEMVVRRVARAADDGYVNALVPGLRATEDARRLGEEIAFACGRLGALSSSGLYADAAVMADREEALWRLFLIALVSPLASDDPFASVPLVSWASGQLPEFGELGPRSGDRRKLGDAVANYRARAEKAGSQEALLAGEPGWTPQRRFERAYERLAFGGFTRAARYEFLVTAGALGLADVEASTLALSSEALDPVTVAAKRVFGIGDPVLLARRSSELAAACEVPIAALDLALYNWGSPDDRYAAGVDDEVLDEGAWERAMSSLGDM